MNVDVKDTAPVSEQQIRQLVACSTRRFAPIRSSVRFSSAPSRMIGDPHLRKMYDFCSSVMLTTGRYKGNPVAVHQRIEGLEVGLFDRWLALFGESCAELLDGETAGLFWRKAVRIAESLKLALFYRPDQPWPMGVA